MGRLEGGLLRPVAVFVVACVVAVGGGACGGSGDDGGGGDAKAGGGAGAVLPEDAFSPETADEEAIVAVYSEYGEAMANREAKRVCATMTAAAKEAVAGGPDCAARMKDIFALGRLSQNRPYIARLRVDGDRARARVKLKLDKQTYPVGFVKQADGGWKINGSGTSS